MMKANLLVILLLAVVFVVCPANAAAPPDMVKQNAMIKAAMDSLKETVDKQCRKGRKFDWRKSGVRNYSSKFFSPVKKEYAGSQVMAWPFLVKFDMTVELIFVDRPSEKYACGGNVKAYVFADDFGEWQKPVVFENNLNCSRM